jgi:8-oxo-dGTP diphosphatase
MSGRLVIEVAAAIIRRGDTMLIAQRRADDHQANLWEFPGGKRERGESFEQCLARELREELGITACVGRLLHDVTHDYPERAVRLCFFECELLDGHPQPLHCQACRWVRVSELKAYSFPPADDELVRMLSKP